MKFSMKLDYDSHNTNSDDTLDATYFPGDEVVFFRISDENRKVSVKKDELLMLLGAIKSGDSPG